MGSVFVRWRAVLFWAGPQPSVAAADVETGNSWIGLNMPRHPEAAIGQQKAIENENDALRFVHSEIINDTCCAG